MQQNYIKKYLQDEKSILIIMFLMEVIALGLLCLFGFFQIILEPTPKYFQMTKNYQLIDPIPLDKPSLTEAELSNWATSLIINSFSYNYHSQDNHLLKFKKNFNHIGWANLNNIFKKDSYLKIIKKEKLIVSAKPLRAPEIVSEGVNRDSKLYTWYLDIPIDVIMQNDAIYRNTKVKVSLKIIRVPETVSRNGVLVAGIIFKPDKPYIPRQIQIGF